MWKPMCRRIGAALLGVSALIASGCAVPSLNGIAEGATPVFDESFLGEWRESDSMDFTVARGQDDTYLVQLHFEDDDRPPVDLQLAVAVVEIAGQRIVDVCLAEDEIDRAVDRYGTLMVPTHLFYRLDIEGDGLAFHELDRDCLKELPGTAKLQHLDESPIITASPERIRRLLALLLADSGAWDKAFTLTRKR